MISLPSAFIDYVLDLTCTIQQIPAPTFREEARAEFLTEQFESLHLKDVERDTTGNVLGRLPGGSGRPLVVSAHMDTVYPLGTELGLQRTKDRIKGPSIGDNSLGLAAVVALGRLLQEEKVDLPGDLWLVGNIAEEGLGNLKGIEAVVDRFGNRPVAYLVIEGMGLGNVLHRGLGVERYKIVIQTPGGHSWVDYGQPSAIHEISALVTRIAALRLPENPCTTLNVGIIHGGTSINTIAAHAWLELDLRSEDSAILAQLVGQVHQLVRGVQHQNVRASIEQIGKRQAGGLPAYHPLVELAARTLTGLGIEPHLDIASTDANLPLSRGYPSICIGITLGNNAHSHEEYILTAPVENGMKQLYAVTRQCWQVMEGWR
jgi:acetylornithine deacetylase/succinyl-diaminopimelate desuccinylase-like protein